MITVVIHYLRYRQCHLCAHAFTSYLLTIHCTRSLMLIFYSIYFVSSTLCLVPIYTCIYNVSATWYRDLASFPNFISFPTPCRVRVGIPAIYPHFLTTCSSWIELYRLGRIQCCLSHGLLPTGKIMFILF